MPLVFSNSHHVILLYTRNIMFVNNGIYFFTCRGRLLTSARNLATTSPLLGDFAILPSNTAVYVFEGTGNRQGSKNPVLTQGMRWVAHVSLRVWYGRRGGFTGGITRSGFLFGAGLARACHSHIPQLERF